MKITREPRPQRPKAGRVAGVERPVSILDSREVVRERWGEIFTFLVEQFRKLDVENTHVLPRVLDLFHTTRGSVIEELRQAIGPDQFTFEKLRPMLDRVSFGEDEFYMNASMRGETDEFLARVRKPKAVLLKLLFPTHGDELLGIVKAQVDEVIEMSNAFDYPGLYIEYAPGSSTS